MSSNIVRLIADEERRVLAALVHAIETEAGLADLLDRWGVPDQPCHWAHGRRP